MSLTERQIELVTQSFRQVRPISAQAAELFYKRLWEIAPETEALFDKSKMKMQGNKLMSTLGAAVAGIRNLDDLAPVLKNLGARHVEYNVTDEMYEPVGAALLWSLEQGLGDDFTEEVKEAWVAVYTLVVETALVGAREARAEKEAI